MVVELESVGLVECRVVVYSSVGEECVLCVSWRGVWCLIWYVVR